MVIQYVRQARSEKDTAQGGNNIAGSFVIHHVGLIRKPSLPRKKVPPIITTPDGVNLYTEDDVRELRLERDTTAQQQYKAGSDYAARTTSNRLRSDAIDWFKGEVRNGSMAKEDAEGIFNGMADAIGWDEVESLNTLFTVVVSYNGTIIAEFEDIEADNAGDAESMVENDMQVEDVETSFTVEYNGDTHSNTVNMTYEFQDEFEYNATEQ